MGATFSRLKNWAGNEDVTTTDLNAEFNNILNNLSPSGMDDYSTNVSQMQSTTNPGEVGTESLATSMQGELERLRFAIKELKGTNQWYETSAQSVSDIITSVNQLQPTSASRIVSGAENSYGLPAYLVPNGAAQSVTIAGATTHLIFYVSNTRYTLTSDVVISSLNAAPSTNNTATLYVTGGTTIDNSNYTKAYGEDVGLLRDTNYIHLTAVGSEIISRTGKLSTFKLINGANSEIFTGVVRQDIAGNYYIAHARRGGMYKSTLLPWTEIKLNSGDSPSIELYTTAWIFLKNDFTATFTLVEPTISGTAPAVAAGGDFWYDTTTNVWKKYSGTAWEDSLSVFLGICSQSTSACVAARSALFHANTSNKNHVRVDSVSSTEIHVINRDSVINVFGTEYKLPVGSFKWLTSSIDTGAIGANTLYYLYISEDGIPKYSLDRPTYMWESCLGWIHPSRAWRCVGYFTSTAGSAFPTLLGSKPISLSTFENEFLTHNTERRYDFPDSSAAATTTQLFSPNTVVVKGTGRKKRFEVVDTTAGSVGRFQYTGTDTQTGSFAITAYDIRGNDSLALSNSLFERQIKIPNAVSALMHATPNSFSGVATLATMPPNEDVWLKATITDTGSGLMQVIKCGLIITDV